MGLIDLLPTVHLFKPGAPHRRQLLSSKAADPSEELGEPRIIGPAVLAIPVRQGREAPQRCQHIQRWTRANRNETIDRPPAAATRDHRRTPTHILRAPEERATAMPSLARCSSPWSGSRLALPGWPGWK